jgi:phenylalanyl-tRNA synthetase alpha chain
MSETNEPKPNEPKSEKNSSKKAEHASLADIKESLSTLKSDVLVLLKEARSVSAIEELKQTRLGRKGPLSLLLRGLGKLPGTDRKGAGEAINKVKQHIEAALEDALCKLKQSERAARIETEKIDVTLPGRACNSGSLHPVTQTLNEVESIFTALGFSIAEGPELESDYYNFEALNIPKNHPARDMQDTFYAEGDLCLRTHTSPVQIRFMENSKPPLRVIAPGTVYRRDSDVTHTPMFHQIEGFMVGEGITFSELKGVLTHFLQELFGTEKKVRFRPSFFPFTEPSAEVDIECVICGADGSECRVCKGTGWLEILGAGMIHPNVFKSVKYDSTKYTGFAFGLGIERIAMLKYGINDLRLFFENDLKFLRQF